MSASDLDRLITGWLDDEAAAGRPAEGLDRVLDETRRRRPRPGWLAGIGSNWIGAVSTEGTGGWPGAATTAPRVAWSTALALAILALALVGAALFVAGQLVMRPTPLGAHDQLAYLGADGLYLADADGGHARLVDGPSIDADTCAVTGEGGFWSPDGRHLAVRAHGFGAGGCTSDGTATAIHVLDSDGRPVASYPAGTGWRVSWSPDGQRIAAWSEFMRTIDVRGTDGRLEVRVALPEGYRASGDYDPVFGPDGTSLVVQTSRFAIEGLEPHRQVIDDTGHKMTTMMPAFSADGTTVVFPGADAHRVYVARTADLHAKTLDLGPDRSIARFRHVFLSPTGDQVLVTTMRDVAFDADGNQTDSTFELDLIDVASGTVQALVTTKDQLIPQGFSPDGRQVLYSRWTDDARASLWTTNTDGSAIRVIVPDAHWGAWQPPVR